MEPLHHYLSQQLHTLTQQVQQMKQHNTKPNDQRAPPTRSYDPRTCYICKKPGHIARDYRTSEILNNQQQRNTQNPRFNNRQRCNWNPTPQHSKNNNFSVQSNTRNNNWQQRRPDRIQPQSFRNNRQFSNFSNKSKEQNHNAPQQQDYRPQKFQIYPTKPSQNSSNHKTKYSEQKYDTAAEYAEQDFPPKLTPAERWNAELKQPTIPYAKAMAEKGRPNILRFHRKIAHLLLQRIIF